MRRYSTSSSSSTASSDSARRPPFAHGRSAGDEAEALYAARMESASRRRRNDGNVLERSVRKRRSRREAEEDTDTSASDDSERQTLVKRRSAARTAEASASDDDPAPSPKRRKPINWIICGPLIGFALLLIALANYFGWQEFGGGRSDSASTSPAGASAISTRNIAPSSSSTLQPIISTAAPPSEAPTVTARPVVPFSAGAAAEESDGDDGSTTEGKTGGAGTVGGAGGATTSETTTSTGVGGAGKGKAGGGGGEAGATQPNPGGGKTAAAGTAPASGTTYTGKSTFYKQNGKKGACGDANPDTAMICALQTEMFAGGSNCGRSILVTRVDNKKTMTVKVADECPSCEGKGYVDFSVSAFESLGTQDEGMYEISWHFTS